MDEIDSLEIPVPTELAAVEKQIDYFSNDADPKALRRNAVNGAFYTAVSQGLKILLSTISQIVLSRLLFPAQFGIVAMVSPVLAFVSLFNDLGLSQAVVQRKEITQEDLSSLYWLGLAASSVCALVAILISPLVALMYHQPAVGPVCAALACQMPLGALAGHSSALMARKMRFGAIAFMEVLSGAVGLVVSIESARLGAGYWALVIGQLALTLTQAIGDRQLSGWRPSRPKWSRTVVPMLKFGGNLTGFNMLCMFSMYSDNVLVGILRGPGALGLFDKSFSLVLRPVNSVTAPISRVATPLLARVIENPEAYRKAYISMLQGIILLGGPGLVMGSVMTNELVTTVLGARWAGAAPIMSWICAAALFMPLSISSFWLFTSQDRTGEQFRTGFVHSGLILVSLLVGVYWGPIGIATSYAFFAPAVHGCFLWVATRRGPIRRSDVIRGIYPLLFALPCAAFVVNIVRKSSGLPPVVQIVAALLVSYLTTVGIVLLFPQGRKSALTLLRLRRSRA